MCDACTAKTESQASKQDNMQNCKSRIRKMSSLHVSTALWYFFISQKLRSSRHIIGPAASLASKTVTNLSVDVWACSADPSLKPQHRYKPAPL